MGSPLAIFDRRTVRRHRDRAARHFADHDFLFQEVAERLVERLDDVARDFPRVLDLGARTGVLAPLLAGRSGIETIVQCDLSSTMMKAARARPCAGDAARLVAVADEEFLPFADGSFDLIVSCLSLHWTNDLPGALLQARRALKPDGLFLAAILGGETLGELRRALIDAEVAETGGAGPRVSPFADVRDAGALLQRAGFALPVVDADTITVSYENALDLMRDLRGMGEANAIVERRKDFTRRSTLLRAAAIYEDLFADEGRMPATFQILNLTAWAPHASQPKALRPGSAAHRLAEALGANPPARPR
ncbi:MAG: methyltransferase domain-containing protein [Proteobacteria bacterium]|nr:methyltransferase domain-containing protein [Pseudomonadota bacterium]